MPCNYKRDYPSNWFTEIRPRILERAKNCCEQCGIANYTIKESGTKVVLTIAHLDHDKLNHEVKDERLMALCQACHLALDLPHHIQNRKYGRDHNGKHQLKLDL